jgi:hypothetical protein
MIIIGSFRYVEGYCLNELIMRNHKFIDGEMYVFGADISPLLREFGTDISPLLRGYSGRNLYGRFLELNENYDSGSYEYYTSVHVTEEHYNIINLVCLNKGWVSVK